MPTAWERETDAGFTWNSQHDTSYPVFIFVAADFWFKARLRENRAIDFTTTNLHLKSFPPTVSIERRCG